MNRLEQEPQWAVPEEEGEVLLQGGEAGVDPFTEHGDEHEIGISPQCISDEDEELDGSKGGDEDDPVKESETVEQSQAIGELIQSDDSAERDAIVDTENADPMGEENSESDGDETVEMAKQVKKGRARKMPGHLILPPLWIHNRRRNKGNGARGTERVESTDVLISSSIAVGISASIHLKRMKAPLPLPLFLPLSFPNVKRVCI
jgi:hypothetical protein